MTTKPKLKPMAMNPKRNDRPTAEKWKRNSSKVASPPNRKPSSSGMNHPDSGRGTAQATALPAKDSTDLLQLLTRSPQGLHSLQQTCPDEGLIDLPKLTRTMVLDQICAALCEMGLKAQIDVHECVVLQHHEVVIAWLSISSDLDSLSMDSGLALASLTDAHSRWETFNQLNKNSSQARFFEEPTPYNLIWISADHLIAKDGLDRRTLWRFVEAYLEEVVKAKETLTSKGFLHKSD